MNKESLDIEYLNCIKTLEELQSVNNGNTDSLVSLLYQNLLSYKFQVENSRKNFENLFNIKETIKEKVESIFIDFFSNKKMFKEFEISKLNQMELSLEGWNNLLDVLPEFLTVASIFKFHGKVQIAFRKNVIVIDGLIRNDPYIETQRSIVNEVTKKLLKRNQLLTFSAADSERTGLSQLKLKLDCSFNPEQVYRIDLLERVGEKSLLGFPNNIANYIIDPTLESIAQKHLIVEIDQELNVRSNTDLLDSIALSSQKTLLHFNFLFNPVTLVLPSRGTISKKASLLAIGNNDSQNYGIINSERKQDVFFRFYTIDLFSLF